ncbi:MAG: UDP-N-acetylenolpyruvoylglucosamine reductase, partial [bacterium]|nr:UDP-N-acetylenolpyruvoylglucosamine reductase [bacterium]
FGYHQINLNKMVILESLFKLQADNKSDMLARMKEYMERRVASQPLNYPSAGCFFRNPKGEGAGRWIDRAGLKGTKIGGAMISDKHANYVINVGEASAADCLEIIKLVQNKVKEKFGIELEPEVKVVGIDRKL